MSWVRRVFLFFEKEKEKEKEEEKEEEEEKVKERDKAAKEERGGRKKSPREIRKN